MTTLMLSYGSNLNFDAMRRRCPKAKPVGPLLLDNGLLVFRSVADIISRPGCRVVGGLWEITPECEVVLDRYEGVRTGLYAKRYLMLEHEGEPTRCLFYQMQVRGISPPSEGYLDVIRKGYEDFGLDQTLLDRAVRHSWRKRNDTPYIRRRYMRDGKPKLARPRRPDPVQQGEAS